MKQPKPTLKRAQEAKCHGCSGEYYDGKADCENVVCSLYGWMPYHKLEPDMTWAQYAPKRVGLVRYIDIDTSNCAFNKPTSE